jgi:hypothetical protein
MDSTLSPRAARAAKPRRKPLPNPAVHAPKLGLRPDEAAAVIGSEGVFRDMRAAGWIEPIYLSNNVTIFDYADVARAFARLRSGERP